VTNEPVRIGLTLPSFVDQFDTVVAVARAADEARLDAVFAYEHLFRVARDGTRRPALDCWVTLGAVAAETSRVGVGSLVARVTLRPPAVLVHAFETVQRVSDGRLIAVLGAGDRESRVENEEFGIPFGTLGDRVSALHDALAAFRARKAIGATYPVWVGGRHPRVLATVSDADGWNRWGGTAEDFAAEAAVVRRVHPDATLTWGGLVVLATSDDRAREKAAVLRAGPGTVVGSPATVAAQLRAYVEAGAAWLILGPVDSSDPNNADLAATLAGEL